jgi:hypothetical protein
LKYYYQIHCDRQKAQGNKPISYPTFSKRLKTLNLHDAIYTPSRREVRPRKSNTPIHDHIRRMENLKQNNVQVIDFSEMKKVEKPVHHNHYISRKKKQSFWNRFKDFFTF